MSATPHRLVLTGGTLFDVARDSRHEGHLLIEGGRIAAWLDDAELARLDAVPRVDVAGCLMAPGLIDLHTHLGEPGDDDAETIVSVTRAAAAGGFTTICAMPDTQPVTDTPAAIEYVRRIASRDGAVRIEPLGALTMGGAGTHLSELAALAEAGCVAFSDGDRPLGDPAVLRNALRYASMLDRPVCLTALEPRLMRGWAMHEGAVAHRLGLPGAPDCAEEIAVARDLALAAHTGARVQLGIITTARGVALLRAARERGAPFSAATTPHHALLDDRWVLGWLGTRPAEGLDPTRLPPYDAATRITPPLRTPDDAAAVVAALADGTIDLLVSDHTPRTSAAIEREYRLVPPGITSLETSLAAALALVHTGRISLATLLRCFIDAPARLLGRPVPRLQPGEPADLVAIDLARDWQVDPQRFHSRGRTSPLASQSLRGQIALTMCAGRIVHDDGRRPVVG
jgi:dihydroorotase